MKNTHFTSTFNADSSSCGNLEEEETLDFSAETASILLTKQAPNRKANLLPQLHSSIACAALILAHIDARLLLTTADGCISICIRMRAA